MPTEIYRETRLKIYKPGEGRPVEFEGTNPFTCRHNVVAANVAPISPVTDKFFDIVIFCISCDTDLTNDWHNLGKNYEYDISHGVWVHVPKTKRKD